MNTLIVFLFILVWPASTVAQNQPSPIGLWKTIDDETGHASSHFEIYEKNGKFCGKVIKLLKKSANFICSECPPPLQNQPLVGMTLLTNLEPYKDYYSNGKVIDPDSGRSYKCNLTMIDQNTLTIRGYLGLPILGRSQTWFRIK